MRSKAPDAVIIVTGIFPRNDNMELMPVIDRINANLAGMADGRKVRYLNVNDKLADGKGTLYEGMMNPDQLHPALKGYQVWADAAEASLHGVAWSAGKGRRCATAHGRPLGTPLMRYGAL